MDRKIKAFLAVVETGKISDAALDIALSQPALTKTIKRLEEDIGSKLFQRHASGMRLTEAGQIFRARAESIRTNYQRAYEEIGNLEGSPPQNYRIYAGSAYYISVAPRLMRQLMSEFPGTKFHFKFALIDRSVPDLSSGEVDLVLGAMIGPPMEGILRRPLFQFDTIPYACKDNPLAALSPAPPSEMARASWLIYAEDTHLKQVFAEFFVTRGLKPPKIQMEFGSLLTAFLTLPKTDYLLPAPSSIRQFAKKLGVIGLEIEAPISPVISGVSYRDLSRDNPITTRALEFLNEITVRESWLE